MLAVMTRLVADAVLVGVLLCAAAGTLAWGRAWVLLAVVRLRLEERLLQRELPGYRAYASRVRHRLVPGLW